MPPESCVNFLKIFLVCISLIQATEASQFATFANNIAQGYRPLYCQPESPGNAEILSAHVPVSLQKMIELADFERLKSVLVQGGDSTEIIYIALQDIWGKTNLKKFTPVEYAIQHYKCRMFDQNIKFLPLLAIIEELLAYGAQWPEGLEEETDIDLLFARELAEKRRNAIAEQQFFAEQVAAFDATQD